MFYCELHGFGIFAELAGGAVSFRPQTFRQYVQDDISVYRRPVRRIHRERGAQHTHGDKALLEQFERRGARQIFRIHLLERPRRADQPRIYHDTRRLADTRDAANDLGLQSKLDVSDINIINFRAIY